MKWVIGAVLMLAVVEIGLVLAVRLARGSFPWLITEKDEVPRLDVNALRKFIEYSFDPHLGWVRKPNSSGTEHGQKGEITFQIDSTGSRSGGPEHLVPVVAAFGDSYVFCRQVEDHETWEAQLAVRKGLGVLNYGVGNYGVDQALLRYEGMVLPSTVRIVVLGFVPESICRIQSCWKHYLEFGNTFAFKPRFVLGPEGHLVLVESPMKHERDFASFQAMLPEIQKVDGFYAKKFRSLQFRFPYLLSLMRNPMRQLRLINAIALRELLRSLGMATPWSENLPFTLVMRDNIQLAHELYGDQESIDLLNAILLRFKKVAQDRGHSPLVLVMPQLIDLKLAEQKHAPYQGFFKHMNSLLPVLDLTDRFARAEIKDLYINDQYGGHLSPAGNSLVAEEVSAWMAMANLKL